MRKFIIPKVWPYNNPRESFPTNKGNFFSPNKNLYKKFNQHILGKTQMHM